MSTDDATARLRDLRREPPRFRRVSVRSIAALSTRMLRIVLAGDELDGFEMPGPASSIRLLLPALDRDEIEMPTWTGNQFELANGERAPIRTFTPRYFDPDRTELTIDVVLHDHGLATDWARAAAVGAEVAISGPGRTDIMPDHVTSHLLVGDESALPAIGQLLESIPSARSVVVHVEITDPAATIELPAHPDAVVTWHEAEPAAEPGASLVGAVTATDELPDHVWVAGEAAAVQRIRTYLFDERGRSRSSVIARGYWKRDR